MRSSKTGRSSKARRGRPAESAEGREKQLIALAVDLAEKQLSEGNASAQVITHFLRLATTREQLEKAKLERETALLTAKADALQSAKRIEDLYANALDAMRSYRSNTTENEAADED